MIAAIYSRKSKFTGKGESVENQIEMCKEYLKRNFNNIDDIEIYEDEGFSGKDTNRPKFKKMIKAAKNKKFNILICYRLDRISRNVADFSNTIEELQKYNIDFISIKEQFDTSTPMGRAMMNIAAVFAQLERETIAERIKDNMVELAKTGRWLGGTSPLGYKSEPIEYSNEDGKSKKMYKLTEVENEMNIVKLIYKLYLEKRGFSSVATYLCKNKYKGKNGGEFSRETARQIVINPVYCISDKTIFKWFKSKGATTYGTPDGIHGLMVYNKREGGKKDKPINEWIIAVGKHRGVISSDIWLKCQNLIQQNNAKSSPRSGTGEKFLLSGMVVCKECGSGMSSWSHFNKKTNFMERYYRCNLRNRASNRCSTKMLNAYKAEEYVANYLKELDINAIKKMYHSNKKNIIDYDAKYEVNKLNKSIEENKKIIQGIIKKIALFDDLDILGMLKNELERLKKENDEMKIKLKELKSILELEDEEEIFLSTMEENISNFKKFYDFVNITQKRILIKGLVESIVWDTGGEEKILEINLIGSNTKLPSGKVKRRE
ncbi:recombinase family protein [Clostridium botulinum]|uniref:Resolvase family protein n=1 Tax=Clostridium botulinum (strain Langeland / NCTC 10281 / Type F) TaxID=441772 RepID=A7GIA9_CLOBL|nr:recombinase family protein [Clostridium botulinum]ABS42673.1 resolvase family protein [Clostridium botulinum F str. Langeland]KKM40623.1 recombinase [Clostridium botulinum]MBY6794411.1 recombinase family protein [Clostridium botulinum]MBY6938199.1 recombinase family protein [Clostridium botulinum]MBY6944900.1 recombinase family protein [Clostridium botulinum]